MARWKSLASGPRGAKSMPGGKWPCAMNPSARQVKPTASVEKNATVRAFWMLTSKLKSVASGVRMDPRIVPSVSTTEMKQRIGVPSGRRIPARVRAERAAPASSIAVTSAASSRSAGGTGRVLSTTG